MNRKEGEAGVCLVICAGDLTVSGIRRGENDLVIAADAGMAYCSLLGIIPDYLIGDFDSCGEEELSMLEKWKEDSPDRVICLPVEKDDTDTLAALKLGLRLGYRDFRLYGATGGRLDHTLANIQSLLYLKNHGATGYLCDGGSMIFVMQNEEVCFKSDMEGYLSLFSLGREARGVTITGMKYTLQNAIVTNDFPIGISNEFIGQEGKISVEEGELVVILQY